MSKTKKIDTSKYAHICIALTHNHKCTYTQHFESSTNEIYTSKASSMCQPQVLKGKHIYTKKIKKIKK
jgi:hypothetical protein